MFKMTNLSVIFGSLFNSGQWSKVRIDRSAAVAIFQNAKKANAEAMATLPSGHSFMSGIPISAVSPYEREKGGVRIGRCRIQSP